MLRTSCVIFIRTCYDQGLIDENKKVRLVDNIMLEKVHVELRNLLMMVLVPKPLHEDGPRQAAYLRATVSRVRFNQNHDLLIIFLDCQSNSDAVKGTRLLAPDLGDDLL